MRTDMKLSLPCLYLRNKDTRSKTYMLSDVDGLVKTNVVVTDEQGVLHHSKKKKIISDSSNSRFKQDFKKNVVT